jgi:hypothetical protein
MLEKSQQSQFLFWSKWKDSTQLITVFNNINITCLVHENSAGCQAHNSVAVLTAIRLVNLDQVQGFPSNTALFQ